MEQTTITVTKSNGDKVPFDANKIREALKHSGARPEQIEEALQLVRYNLYDGISTHKIYQTAYRVLRKRSHHAAGRYRLKKAMLELGPSGYPFEKFVGKLLDAQGYSTLVDQIVQGACITHEVDVVARKQNKQIMVECKYHSDNKRKSDVKVALYIHSRFLDVSKAWKKEQQGTSVQYEGMLVTNTRFSDDATQFAECAGLQLVSWDYPSGNSLKDWIDKSGLHPLTSLSLLKRSEKQFLLEKGVVLCSDLKDYTHLLHQLGINQQKIQKILREADLLAMVS